MILIKFIDNCIGYYEIDGGGFDESRIQIDYLMNV